MLDEADEMLDLGFREDLEFILDATPTERRTLLFSATIPPRDRGAGQATTSATPCGSPPRRATSRTRDIEYRAVRVAPNEREHAIVNLLRYFEARGAIVFCSTREAVRHLHANLLERGFRVVALSGELSQNERTRALQDLRDGRARVCVATDVAARGLDLPDLGLVIHADLPNDRDTLLHRSGRTGRAGRKGTSVLVVAHTRRRRAERLLERRTSRRPGRTRPRPTTSASATASGCCARSPRSRSRRRRISAWAQALLAERGPEAVAVALVRDYRARLPAPEELLKDGADRAPERTRPDGGGDTVWFRMPVGRERNADPRWLVPLICRRGHITKREIGAIRIGARETRFEIASRAADRFTAAIAKPADRDNDVRIELLRPEHAAAVPERTGAIVEREPRRAPPRDGRGPVRRARAPGADGPRKPYGPAAERGPGTRRGPRPAGAVGRGTGAGRRD